MLTALFFGMLVGLNHALEADHLAAVSTLVSRGSNLRRAARQGAVWGVGHTLTLLLFGGTVLALGQQIPEHYSQYLEMAVGGMLITLGLDLLRRLLHERVHFHIHHHEDQTHFHAHSHQTHANHQQDPHRHIHRQHFPLRALFVGMTHGLAGSAALVVLAVGSVSSPLDGLLYMLLFGIGSIIGMALLATAISLPFRYYSDRGITFAYNSLQLLAALFTLGLGSYMVVTLGIATGLI